MANRKKRGLRKVRSRGVRWIPLALIACFVMVILYLYGQVEIGLNIRANAELKAGNAELQQKLDRLNAEVVTLKSYPRILAIVEPSHLGPVSPERLGQLEVDLTGAYEPDWRSEPLHYASFAPVVKQKRIKAGGGN